uniref:Putative secreted protein n=1 Tax=Ixodes ricinus TaxID=34613 RepID=A0A6B0TS23_IXORI
MKVWVVLFRLDSALICAVSNLMVRAMYCGCNELPKTDCLVHTPCYPAMCCGASGGRSCHITAQEIRACFK